MVTSTSPEATNWIAIATAVHNNRRNATTKLSPNQILLGYETKLIPTETNEATERQLETMIKKRLAAIEAINQAAKTKAPIPSQYKEGDQVWLEATHLKLQHQKMKLAPKCYGPSGSSKKYHLLRTRFSYRHHGVSTTCFMHHFYHPIMRRHHMDQISPDHHLTLSTEKKSMRWSALLITIITEGLESYNISSNGRDILKAITYGNQLIKYMPLT